MTDGTDKILIIAPGGARARGGMGRMVAHLVRQFADDGGLSVAVLDTYGPRVNERHAVLAMPFHFAGALARLILMCAARRPALAHVHMAGFGSVYRKSAAMLVCRFFRVPVILHIHGGDLDRFHAVIGPLRRRALRWVVGGAVEVLVLGEYWRDFVVAHLGVPQMRVTILYNGVPRPKHRPPREARSRCELLFLGMVWRQKGMDELLSALGMPALADLDWHMTIAGIGMISEYRSQARALGISDRVDFVGWTDESATHGLLERADVLVLPSHFECLPMAVIEAMSYGLAVIATPVGSVTEAVEHEKSGLLVPVADSERLAHAVKRLIDDPSLRRQLGGNAYARFCQTFDLDIFESRMREIYRKHLAVGPHSLTSDKEQAMPKKLRLPALLAVAIAVLGAAAAVFAQNAASPESAFRQLGGSDAIKVVSSSTNMQSFLWIIDDKNSTITFCFTTASPEAGAQYDFGCRQRPAQEATMH